ncbi:MAG: phytanoyl-CoA dioxygenase family protein [Myxococcales bacterium]|nr:phytanoyl-CoA dioxygenase family protein [Myxococcales bacterium]
MAELEHFQPDAPASAINAAIVRDGAAIIDNLLPQSELRALSSELRPFIDGSGRGRDDFTGRATTRTGALVARSPESRALVTHPVIGAQCDAFLLPFCDRYQLHLTQVIRLMPGQGKQTLHRDRLAWGGYLPRQIEPQLNTIWAVTDFTRENGATRVVPGSATWDTSRRAAYEEQTQAEMSAGSVMLYTGSVLHGGGENRSDAERIGVNITYCLGWLRQEENQYLSCPPEVAATLSPELQELLGYTMGSYALGYFSRPDPTAEDGIDTLPPEALLGRKPRTKTAFAALEADQANFPRERDL